MFFRKRVYGPRPAARRFRPIRTIKSSFRRPRGSRTISRSFTKSRLSIRRLFKRRRRRSHVTRIYGPQPFNPCVITKLKYSAVNTANLVGSTTQSTLYNLNSVFQPTYVAGPTHQPYGYDQYAAIFSRYRVFKTTWTIQFSTSTTALVQVGACAQNFAPSTPATFEAFAEQPGSLVKLVHPYGPVSMIKGHRYLPSLMGLTSSQYKANEGTSALTVGTTVTANPTEVQTLQVMFNTPNTQVMYWMITLEYHVEFYDPTLLPQS